MKKINIVICAFCLCGFYVHSQAEDLVLGATIKRLKQVKSNELIDLINAEAALSSSIKPTIQGPELAGKKTVITTTPTLAENPVLKGIYGVNDELRADIIFKYETIAVSNDYFPANLGQWMHGYVFSEGVLLTVTPLDLTSLKSKVAEMKVGLADKRVCKLLYLDNKKCLWLVPAVQTEKEQFSKGASNEVFQDQMRTLVTQPVPPLNYSSTNPNRRGFSSAENMQNARDSELPQPARESAPTRPASIPK